MAVRRSRTRIHSHTRNYICNSYFNNTRIRICSCSRTPPMRSRCSDLPPGAMASVRRGQLPNDLLLHPPDRRHSSLRLLETYERPRGRRSTVEGLVTDASDTDARQFVAANKFYDVACCRYATQQDVNSRRYSAPYSHQLVRAAL